MVTPAELTLWSPRRLEEIADAVWQHRSALLEQSDELARGQVPSTWTFDSARAAVASYNALSEGLATQIAEAKVVTEALQTAAEEIREAKRLMSGAYDAARGKDIAIDATTGSVRVTASYTNTSDAAYAYTQAHYVRQLVRDALSKADQADTHLAAALNRAAWYDTNAVGTLEEQRQVHEFLKKTPEQQAQLLFEHPELADLLGDYASPEAKALLGGLVADELNAAARDSTVFGQRDEVERLTALMQAFNGDADVMAAMYTKLEPEGTLLAFSNLQASMYIGSNVQELGVLAEELRTGLQIATQNPSFDGEAFGRDLVRYATYDITDAERAALYDVYGSDGQNHAATLDFLLRTGDYGEDFVRGVAWQLDELERTNPHRAASWAHHDSFASPLTGLDDLPMSYQPDPTAAAFGQLGKHPQLGLEFFTAPGDGQARVEHYFSERDWTRDGFRGISEAIAGIGTDPTNATTATAQTNLLVSEFFNRVPDQPGFTPGEASCASEPIGRLLKNFIPAVNAAVVGGSHDVGAGLQDIDYLDYHPKLMDQPTMNRADLEKLMKVAVSTPEGMARVAEGVAAYRQEQLMAYAREHGPLSTESPNRAVQDIMERSARLEGYAQNAVAHVAIDGARSKDQQVAVFTELVSEAIGLVPVPGADEVGEVLGETGKKLWGAAWNHTTQLTTDTITETFGSATDAEIARQIRQAQLGREGVQIRSAQALLQAGLIELPQNYEDTWLQGQRIIPIGDITDDEWMGFVNESAALLGKVLDGSDIDDQYQDPFGSWNFDK